MYKNILPLADKERISQLVDNILSTFAERIQQLDWMSDSTKQKALIKLHAIVKKVGYPDKWKDYSSIRITKDDIIANLRATTHYTFKRDIAKIGKPVDRTEWQMTPPTINAYYEPTQNNINFPAGILQPPFYFPNGDDAVNYGAIGVVIGHEITHGFDDQGRQYDGDGNLKDWWSAEDARRFKIRRIEYHQSILWLCSCRYISSQWRIDRRRKYCRQWRTGHFLCCIQKNCAG